MIGKILKSIPLLAWAVALTACFAQEPQSGNETSYGQKEAPEGKFNFVTITGQEVKEKDFKLAPGMEVITVRGVNVVAPKGTRVEDKGSWIKVEDVGEFLGRKFDEIQARLEQIEKQQASITEELIKIKEALDRAADSSRTSP